MLQPQGPDAVVGFVSILCLFVYFVQQLILKRTRFYNYSTARKLKHWMIIGLVSCPTFPTIFRTVRSSELLPWCFALTYVVMLSLLDYETTKEDFVRSKNALDPRKSTVVDAIPPDIWMSKSCRRKIV